MTNMTLIDDDNKENVDDYDEIFMSNVVLNWYSSLPYFILFFFTEQIKLDKKHLEALL